VTAEKEDHDLTAAWVKELGVEYPYGYFKDSKLSEATEHTAYPHAALIDPKGVIVWAGHPASLSDSIIEKHLAGASKYLSYGWSDTFEPVAKQLAKQDFGKAIAEVDKLVASGAEGAADVRTAVIGMLDARIATMSKALEKGDFYAANIVVEELLGRLGDLPQAATIDAAETRLGSDKEVKEILAGQKKLHKIMDGELRKDKQLEGAIKDAEKLVKKYPGTIVERQANEFITKLKDRLKG